MRKRKWTKQQLITAVKDSTSIRQVLKQLRLKEAGGNYSQIRKYIQEYGIDDGHFKGRGWSKGMRGIGKPRKSLREILVKDSDFQSYKLKKRLLQANVKKAECELCGWKEVSEDGRLPLELDHINGDSKDNRLVNLRILCPNCHSLQPTHRGRNKKKKY